MANAEKPKSKAANMTLHEALLKAQGLFTPVIKDADNPYFKSEYATLHAVTAMLAPILRECGLLYTATFRDGLWVTTVRHVSGESFECAIPFACADNRPQGIGSAVTYYRRYGLQAAFGVVVIGDAADDDGNRANGNKMPPSKADDLAF